MKKDYRHHRNKKAFTIIEVIITMGMLGVLSVFVFSVATPLRIKTEQVNQKLKKYAEVQYLMIFLNQLISIFDAPQVVSASAIRTGIGTGIFPVPLGDILVHEQKYAIFSKELSSVLCGVFHVQKPNSTQYVYAEFQCHFLYPNRQSFHTFLNIDKSQVMNTHLSITTKSKYTQIKINIDDYEITAGFLPSIKQMIQ